MPSDRVVMAREEWDRIAWLEEALCEYAQHNSWRCEHRDANFYLVGRDAKKNPDCPCGLDATLRELGLAPETDENRDVEFDHRSIEPAEARLVWETGFWDDETFIEWMAARSGVGRAQAEDMVAFMRSQRDGSVASRDSLAPTEEDR